MVDNRPDACAIKKQLESLRKSFTAGGQQCSSHSIAASNDGMMMNSNNISSGSGMGSSSGQSINNNKNLLHRAVSVGRLSLIKPLFKQHNSTSKIAVAEESHHHHHHHHHIHTHLRSNGHTNLLPLQHHNFLNRSQIQTPQPHTHRFTTDTVTKFVPKKATSKVVPRVLRGPTPMTDSGGPPSPFIIRHF